MSCNWLKNAMFFCLHNWTPNKKNGLKTGLLMN